MHIGFLLGSLHKLKLLVVVFASTMFVSTSSSQNYAICQVLFAAGSILRIGLFLLLALRCIVCSHLPYRSENGQVLGTLFGQPLDEKSTLNMNS